MEEERYYQEKGKLRWLGEQWIELEEKFRKQIEKACYAGVAIVWVFSIPQFSNEFNNDFQKFNFPDNLTLSLICFVATLVLYLLYNIVVLYWRYLIYRSKLKHIKNERLILLQPKPHLPGLIMSFIGLVFVFLGYYWVGAFVYRNIF